MIQDIINYLPIRPGLLTSGQPERDQFDALKDAGIQTIINLVPSVSGDYLMEEPILVANLGLEYIPIPVIWDSPTRANLARYFETLDARRDRLVLAHCVVNYRVSAFTFLYRVLRENAPLEEARQVMLSIWEPNAVWLKFIQENLENSPS